MRKILSTGLLLLTVCLTGCMTTQNAQNNNPIDPMESFNRWSFQFNEDLDTAILKPTATFYERVTPWFVRDGITNFFVNLNEIPTVANDLLQVNPAQALNDSGRFVINTLGGLGGTIDVATRLGLPHHTQDFGLTLARWGFTKSPYIVLPFLGPSTLRDVIGMPVDYWGFSVYPHIRHQGLRKGLLALNLINVRANLLGAQSVVQQAALDPYVFFRDAYLQRRAALIAHNDKPKWMAKGELHQQFKKAAPTQQTTDSKEFDHLQHKYLSDDDHHL